MQRAVCNDSFDRNIYDLSNIYVWFIIFNHAFLVLEAQKMNTRWEGFPYGPFVMSRMKRRSQNEQLDIFRPREVGEFKSIRLINTSILMHIGADKGVEFTIA